MRTAIVGLCVSWLLSVAAGEVLAQMVASEPLSIPSTITVRGRGEVVVAPEEAVIGMGAVAQADRAELAQREVNQILTKAIASLTALGVRADDIQTTGINLSPVYSGTALVPSGSTVGIVQEPRIVGYRASNTLRIRLDNLRILGQVIDQSVIAGANQLEDLNFQLKDEYPYRQEALSRAAADARLKADAIAGALGVQVLGVRQVDEAGAEVIRPQIQYRQLAAAQGAIAATPVRPGEIRIEASVNVAYMVGSRPRALEGGAAAPAPATQPQNH